MFVRLLIAQYANNFIDTSNDKAKTERREESVCIQIRHKYINAGNMLLFVNMYSHSDAHVTRWIHLRINMKSIARVY